MEEISAVLLSAGIGARLRPLTNQWPKCLMPVQGFPILRYWLEYLSSININRVAVNTHYQHLAVEHFVSCQKSKLKVDTFFEKSLLGTAGTLRALGGWIGSGPVLVIHTDNWCNAELSRFIHFHKNERPQGTHMSMMTFDSDEPHNCGIVSVDNNGIVTDFYEKVTNPPGITANAAVYILEQDVIEYINCEKSATDFSLEIIPAFKSAIATWHHKGFHIDIGTPHNLYLAQTTFNHWCRKIPMERDEWDIENAGAVDDLMKNLHVIVEGGDA